MQHDAKLDTVQHDFQVGAITITVEAPVGVPIRGVAVDVHPPDRETFLHSMEAVGGLEAVTLPEMERGYPQAAIACPQGPDGERNYAVSVAIKEPPREEAAAPQRHPFFGALAERQEREAAAEAEKAGEPA